VILKSFFVTGNWGVTSSIKGLTLFMRRLKKILLRVLAVLAIAYGLLLIPGPAGNKKIMTAAAKPFTWNRDSLWHALEENFTKARARNPAAVDSNIVALQKLATPLFELVAKDSSVQPGDERLGLLLDHFFSMAPLIAARQTYTPWLIGHYNRIRNTIKKHSQHWDMNTPAARNTVYQQLYGMRAAVEEVLLQSDSLRFDPAMILQEGDATRPAAKIFGITVHSGDLLVSRGGAEVSALISRGNDYPGNFSHVALVYVDPATKTPWLVEAHIEKGVAIANADQYEADKKLRFMVLSPRNDLPALQKDPGIPAKAAAFAYNDALQRHIPYDFKMNFQDSAALFCSEVGSYAYRRNGIQLWQATSTISSQGVVNWLHAFGVEHFVTQMPADLEYDPQLSVMAEWRDPQTLFKDHLDNAVMDVLLEQADKGETIGYNHWMLPLARVLKGWSWLMNRMGKVSKIPEGMSAIQALKNNDFVQKHVALKAATEKRAAQFILKKGYRPPYWVLVQLAREGVWKS
jgi:hypothetical protein